MEVLRAQVGVGYVLQLLCLAVVELLNVAMLVVDHLNQTPDLRLKIAYLLLTRHRSLDRETNPNLITGTSRQQLLQLNKSNKPFRISFVNKNKLGF